MKLKNQGKGLGGLLLLSFFLAPGVQAKAADASKAKVSWYANINRALMHVDDGFQKDTYFVDNFSKSSRAGITGETKLDECLTVGGKLEMEFATASTSSVNQLNRNNASTVNQENVHEGIKIRQVDTWVKGDFGQLSLGHGSTASWTTVSSDLSGTADTVGYAGPYGMASGFYFHPKDSLSAVTPAADPRVSGVFNPYDGLARKDRIRYDSPKFYGFSLSGSINSSEKDHVINTATTAGKKYGSDIALRYEDTIQHDIKLLGAISLYKISKGSDEKAAKVWDASFAALHEETGINGAIQYASKTLPNPTAGTWDKKPKFARVALGLISDLNHYGPTNFVVDYAYSKNSIINDDKGKGYGFGVVQQLKKVNSEVYFGVRNLKYKVVNDTTPYDKILAVMTGLRINLGGKLS